MIELDIEKTFDADITQTDFVVDFIGETLMNLQLDRKLVNSFRICVEEIFVNIASYAYEGNKGNAVVKITKEDNIITLVFSDQGIEFNPVEMDDPNIEAAPEDRRIGGLGIFMVKQMMDSVDYQRVNGSNILTLKKAI